MCLVRDVVTVSVKAMYAQVSDSDPEFAGRREQTRAPSKQEATHVGA